MSGVLATGGLGGGEFGGYGGSVSGAVLSASAAIKQQLDTLTEQASNGYVSTTFAGLGAGASTALAVAPALASNQALQTTINVAAPMQVAQTALSQISTIASNLFSQTNNLNGVNPSEIDSIAASARDALVQMAGLLDTTDAGSYVFAGQDSANAPVPSPDNILSSGFFTQVQSAVTQLGTSGAAATAAATLATASSNAAGTSPFSTTLSQPAAAANALRPTLTLADGTTVPTGIVASANSDIASTGSSTTGSYMRDIMRALATVGSLSSSQASDSGLSGLVADVHSSLGDAITALNSDAGVMGDRQTRLTNEASALKTTATALQSQLSGTQDVDMAATLSRLSATQTRLQASYQLIAGLQSLSLAKFLSATAA
jgi:flagellar hook-associated protein 3 FlgL